MSNFFNAMDLLPITFGFILHPNPHGKNQLNSQLSHITFGVILPLKLHGKISTNSQINSVTLDE